MQVQLGGSLLFVRGGWSNCCDLGRRRFFTAGPGRQPRDESLQESFDHWQGHDAGDRRCNDQGYDHEASGQLRAMYHRRRGIGNQGHGSHRDNDGQNGADRCTPRMLGLRGDAFTCVVGEAGSAVDQIAF